MTIVEDRPIEISIDQLKNIQLLEYAKKARALIDRPEKWCQGARQKYVVIDGKDVFQYCSTGAVFADYDEESRPHAASLYKILAHITPAISIPYYNDSHSYEEVMGIWDAAISYIQQLVDGDILCYS